jgi:hypothetical protein
MRRSPSLHVALDFGDYFGFRGFQRGLVVAAGREAVTAAPKEVGNLAHILAVACAHADSHPLARNLAE